MPSLLIYIADLIVQKRNVKHTSNKYVAQKLVHNLNDTAQEILTFVGVMLIFCISLAS